MPMVLYQSSDGKRVHAIRRGSDGSAFQNWLKSQVMSGIVKMMQRIEQYQPRSSNFRFFKEEFLKTCKDGDGFEIDKKGFKTWKNMSNEADKLNSAYLQLLLNEESEMQWANDAAAHSADGPNYDKVLSEHLALGN